MKQQGYTLAELLMSIALIALITTGSLALAKPVRDHVTVSSTPHAIATLDVLVKQIYVIQPTYNGINAAVFPTSKIPAPFEFHNGLLSHAQGYAFGAENDPQPLVSYAVAPDDPFTYTIAFENIFGSNCNVLASQLLSSSIIKTVAVEGQPVAFDTYADVCKRYSDDGGMFAERDGTRTVITLVATRK